jgi:glycosyltransferase involved in cell wall biosynthesis
MQRLSRQSCLRVIHMSSGHYADDSRIFWKECVSLARAGYNVTFVVPCDDLLPEGCVIVRHGVRIIAVRRYSERLWRLLATPIVVVLAGLRQGGSIFHFHDAELIPHGLLLRAFGKRVIYDAHEDFPRDVLIKHWIPNRLRRPASLTMALIEWIAGRSLSGVVAATPHIARRFPSDRVALVQNFASEFAAHDDVPYQDRRTVAYVGGISTDRCAVEMVQSIGRIERFPDVSLVIAGIPHPPSLLDELAVLPGWQRVAYRGHQDRAGVRSILAASRAGLVLFNPLQSYIESQPIKLFEYMAAGIPVIAADFPRFREIVNVNGCGICVPPKDVAAIASAIEWLLAHPAEAEEMGRRGREAARSLFSWRHEELELLEFYERIADPAAVRSKARRPGSRKRARPMGQRE